jgi:glycosyltransferase involved in cell wall biosynthesis
MRIAQVAPLQVAVPPKQYGGTERCIHNLTESLVRLGHTVTLFATGDSQTKAELIAPIPHAINFDPMVDARALHIAMLKDVYDQADRFDIIHSHLDYLALPFAEHSPTPTISTLHGRLDMPEFQRVLRAYRRMNFVSISQSQQSYLPDLNWIATVHHSVDVDDFPFYPNPGDYLVFVGRISPEKGPERAIEVAKLAKIPLKIAAKVDPADRDYFEQTIKPLLDHPLITFIGEVNETQKREIMGQALALIVPIAWPEPFGIVFIEALACGTPVLTCPYGSVPELLRDGVTGYIRRTTEELAEAALSVGATISRRACRDYARQRFDNRRMALEYLRAYDKVLRQQSKLARALAAEFETAEEEAAAQLPALALSEADGARPTNNHAAPGIPLPPEFSFDEDEGMLLP